MPKTDRPERPRSHWGHTLTKSLILHILIGLALASRCANAGNRCPEPPAIDDNSPKIVLGDVDAAGSAAIIPDLAIVQRDRLEYALRMALGSLQMDLASGYPALVFCRGRPTVDEFDVDVLESLNNSHVLMEAWGVVRPRDTGRDGLSFQVTAELVVLGWEYLDGIPQGQPTPRATGYFGTMNYHPSYCDGCPPFDRVGELTAYLFIGLGLREEYEENDEKAFRYLCTGGGILRNVARQDPRESRQAILDLVAERTRTVAERLKKSESPTGLTIRALQEADPCE